MADLFPGRGLVLESSGCRRLWFSDQSAPGSLLHAGVEYHAGAWPYSSLWRVRYARYWSHALLHAFFGISTVLVGRCPALVLLAFERWPYGDGLAQSSADRSLADP